MLLTKPRRQIIYGLYWTLLGTSALCFLCLYSRYPESDLISGSVETGEFIRIGALDWLWATQIISYWTTPPAINWTFQIQWPGLVGNLLIVGLVVWFCCRGWRWSVRSEAIRGLNCDTCGYDLHKSLEARCPECGEKMKEESFPRAEWLSILGELLIAVFMLCLSLLSPILALGLILDMTSELIPLFFLPLAFVLILLLTGGLVVYPWTLSGCIEFEGNRDTPRKRKSKCLWLAWVPTLIVLVILACEMMLYFYNAPLYHDSDEATFLLKILPGAVLYGGLMHVVLARRLNKAFQNSGVCFECAATLNGNDPVLCQTCSQPK